MYEGGCHIGSHGTVSGTHAGLGELGGIGVKSVGRTLLAGLPGPPHWVPEQLPLTFAYLLWRIQRWTCDSVWQLLPPENVKATSDEGRRA